MSIIGTTGGTDGGGLGSESAATGVLTLMHRKLGACAPNGKGKLRLRHSERANFRYNPMRYQHP